MPSLSTFSFPIGRVALISDAVWIQLARHVSLKTISLHGHLYSVDVHAILEHVPSPFQSLRSLEFTTWPSAINRLMPYLPRLQTIILTVIPLDPGVISLIAETCKDLRCLDLENFGFNDTDLDDCQIERLARLTPRLRTLNIDTRYTCLTAQALQSLAKNCHELQRCRLFGSFDILEFGTSGNILFPYLRFLSISHVEKYEVSSIEAHTAVLRYHMPLLESWEFGPPFHEL